MNENERIEAALGRRPSDERDYDEPLRALGSSGPARGVVMTRVRPAGARRGAVPALASLLALVVLAAGVVLAAWPRGNAGPVGPAGPSGSVRATGSTALVEATATPQESVQPGTPAIGVHTIVDKCQSAVCSWSFGFQEPVVSGIPAAAADKINATISSKIAGYIAEFKAKTGSGDGRHDSLLGLYSVEFASPKILSLKFAMTIDVGNGYDEYRSLNFRVADGSLIELGDLFSNQSAGLAVISTEARRQLRDLEAGQGTDGSEPPSDAYAKWIDDGTKPVMSNFDKAWTLLPGILTITFDTAQVAPRAFGTPQVFIGFEALRGTLAPNGPAADAPIAPQATTSGSFEPKSGPGFFHQVGAGETAASIAAMYGLEVWELEVANPQVADWDHLVAGQALNILPHGYLGERPAQSIVPTPQPTSMTYYVKSGDYLSKVASQFNVRLCEILAANPGLDPNHIEVGQRIYIPVAGTVTCGGG